MPQKGMGSFIMAERERCYIVIPICSIIAIFFVKKYKFADSLKKQCSI